MTKRPLRKFVEQHSEDAAFLWILRDRACNAADHTVKDLFLIDQRIEAHIDGLREAATLGTDIAIQNCMEYPEAGETFTLAVLALENPSEGALQGLATTVEANPGAIKGIVSAAGWATNADLDLALPMFTSHPNQLIRMAAVAAYSTRRVDPGDAITAYFHDDGPVRARALRLAGELGSMDLLLTVQQGVETLEGPARDWAAWSGVLLGCRGLCLDHLKLQVAISEFGWRALQLVLIAMEPEEGATWLGETHRETPALLLAGAGLIGQSKFASWTLHQFSDPYLAPLAAESFSMITGLSVPSVDESSEEESSDPFLDRWMSSLSCPEIAAVADLSEHIAQGKGRFLFGSKPQDVDRADIALRYRRIAAVHRAMSKPGLPIPNHAARRIVI